MISRTSSTQQVVADVMSAPVLTTTPRCKATDAALVIALNNITVLPVLDNGSLVGLFSEEGLLRVPSSEQRTTTVGDLMTQCQLIATPDAKATELSAQMRRLGLHSVPVLHENTLVGIVTRHDLAATGRR